VQDLIRHCHSGLGAPDLQQRLLTSLRRVVPTDAAFFATADPESLLFTGGLAEEPLDAATAMFIDNEFGAADVNKFAALATAASPVSSLDSVTGGDRFASPRYRDIMRPLGLGDELRVALVAGSRCWGYLCLHRADGSSGFTEAELLLVASVAPHLGHALRQALLLRRAPVSGQASGPGVVVLSDELSVVAVTGHAAELLAELESSIGLPLPACIYAAAATLRAI
jgi:GAF domain-containing protein